MPIYPDLRYKQVGGRKRAQQRYGMIKHRIENPIGKNSCYVDVKLLIDQETFVKWFQENDFEGCTVDRIDNNKHYEMGNLQTLTKADNIRKDKVIAKEGKCRCYNCGQIKSLDKFVVDKRRLNGHGTSCKPCDNKRRSRK